MAEKTKHVEMDRICLACKGLIRTTASGLKAHFKACKGTK